MGNFPRKGVANAIASGNDPAAIELPLVLVVENNDDNLLLMLSLLEDIPCQAIAAVDGKRALRLAITYCPNLIMTEIILPELDGFELLLRLRETPKTRLIPVVAVTVMASEANREQIFQAGFCDYLSKPYSLEDFQTIVLTHLHAP